jgi:uncharacterized membrane protein
MGRLRSTFIKGLAAVLPVTLTLYLVYWLGTTAEEFLGRGLKLILPAGTYRPGMGLMVGFLVVLFVGSLINQYVVNRFIRLGEQFLARIPLVKTIFGALKDLTRFLPAAGERRDLQRVVFWKLGKARVVGFVTSESVHPQLGGGGTDMVAVYFPLSYTIGGYTLFLPRDELEHSDFSVEQALRMVLIGGITSDMPHSKEAGRRA